MTHFEYLAIAPSLILSFSLARALSNLAPIFNSKNRYWIHITWVVVLLVNHILIFWSYWLFQANEAWTLAEFVLFLIHPVGLLVVTSLLVPNTEVSDYRTYFESIRIHYYVVWIVIMAADPLLSLVVLEIPITHPFNLISVSLVVVFTIGVVARKYSVDSLLVLLVTTNTLVITASAGVLEEIVLPLIQG